MPSCASLLAVARPIPLVPPVISAVDEFVIICESSLEILEQFFISNQLFALAVGESRTIKEPSEISTRSTREHVRQSGRRQVAKSFAVCAEILCESKNFFCGLTSLLTLRFIGFNLRGWLL